MHIRHINALDRQEGGMITWPIGFMGCCYCKGCQSKLVNRAIGALFLITTTLRVSDASYQSAHVSNKGLLLPPLQSTHRVSGVRVYHSQVQLAC